MYRIVHTRLIAQIICTTNTQQNEKLSAQDVHENVPSSLETALCYHVKCNF
jgi:hypothetical protein